MLAEDLALGSNVLDKTFFSRLLEHSVAKSSKSSHPFERKKRLRALMAALVFAGGTALAWLMSHAPSPQHATSRHAFDAGRSANAASMRVVSGEQQPAEEDDDFSRMQASLLQAQQRLDGWGREAPGMGNQGLQGGTWAWSGGATPGEVLEGTALALEKGKVRVQAEVQAARTRGEVASMQAVIAEKAALEANARKELAERQAEQNLLLARVAEGNLQQARDATSIASDRAAKAEAAALSAAAEAAESRARMRQEAKAASHAERKTTEAAALAAEASAAAVAEASAAAVARAEAEANFAVAKAEAAAALAARNVEAERAASAEVATRTLTPDP